MQWSTIDQDVTVNQLLNIPPHLHICTSSNKQIIVKRIVKVIMGDSVFGKDDKCKKRNKANSLSQNPHFIFSLSRVPGDPNCNIFVSKENKDLADSLYQLIHSQPLNPKNLESSFPPNYSRFPIPIGISDSLLRNSAISCSSR